MFLLGALWQSMKIRCLFYVLIIIALISVAVFFFVNIDNVSFSLPFSNPKAEITILEWEQNEFLQKYGKVKISYRVENSGHVDFDFYELWFEVTCVDDSKFQESMSGFGLDVGKYVTARTYVDTWDKQAATVELTDYELKVY